MANMRRRSKDAYIKDGERKFSPIDYICEIQDWSSSMVKPRRIYDHSGC